jgi:hypothetical protein
MVMSMECTVYRDWLAMLASARERTSSVRADVRCVVDNGAGMTRRMACRLTCSR